MREARQERIPQPVQPENVADFRDALAIRLVLGAPVGERFKIEILAQAIDAQFLYKVCQGIKALLPGVRVAQIEQEERPAIGVGNQIFRMFARNGRSPHHALWLEPKDVFHAHIVNRR